MPTDRGYRFYVDYLQDMQRLASNEKARIEQQYSSRLEELDQLLSHTSTLLSHVSHKTGLVLSPEVEGQRLKRIELIPLGPKRLLAIVVTQTGLVRHWPIRLRRDASSERLNSLNRFLNDHIAGSTLPEVHDALLARIDRAAKEIEVKIHGPVPLFVRVPFSDAPRYLNGQQSFLQQRQRSQTTTFQFLWASGGPHGAPPDQSIGHSLRRTQ